MNNADRYNFNPHIVTQNIPKMDRIGANPISTFSNIPPITLGQAHQLPNLTLNIPPLPQINTKYQPIRIPQVSAKSSYEKENLQMHNFTIPQKHTQKSREINELILGMVGAIFCFNFDGFFHSNPQSGRMISKTGHSIQEISIVSHSQRADTRIALCFSLIR